ncbi:MAG: hypothetical protein ABEI57_05695 [Halapricum sp.]
MSDCIVIDCDRDPAIATFCREHHYEHVATDGTLPGGLDPVELSQTYREHETIDATAEELGCAWGTVARALEAVDAYERGTRVAAQLRAAGTEVDDES